MPSVLVADDHRSIRRSLKAYLTSAFPELSVSEARNGVQALEMVSADPPDLVVMDLAMPHLDGMEATREIKARWPEVKVLILILDPGQCESALEAGADACLTKEGPSEELLDTVNSLLDRGDAQIC